MLSRLLDYNGYKFTGGFSWLDDVYKVLPNILWGIMALAGMAGIVYSIILGVNLAKSDSEDKRKTAATRMKNTIIGVAVLIIVIVFINILLPILLHAIWPKEIQKV